MKEITIEQLAYRLVKAKSNKLPGAIFFIGAGASVSGGIPLANTLTNQILRDFNDNPLIRDINETDKNYANLMECLLPYERTKLLKDHIDNSKVNLTHLYLAQLLSKDYCDYILTVNFDNLMVRALALENIFPPTYDLAVLNELTTSKLQQKSIIHLHGQSHGLWLLNTRDEMAKVNKTLPRIFDSIKDNRPWIFIGYSGDDPVFEHIRNMGRFDNGLYWVAYKNNVPNEKVQNLLNEPHSNSYLLKGYDSDSFMQNLCKKMDLLLDIDSKIGIPKILEKPFSLLRDLQMKIVSEPPTDGQSRHEQKLENIQKLTYYGVKIFEKNGLDDIEEDIEDIKLSSMIDKITTINLLESWNDNLDVIADIEEKIKTIQYTGNKLVYSVASIYFYWGNKLLNDAISGNKKQLDLIDSAVEKYKKAITLFPESMKDFQDWDSIYYLGIAKALSQKSEFLNKELCSENEKELYKYSSIAISRKAGLSEAYVLSLNALSFLLEHSVEDKSVYVDELAKLCAELHSKPSLLESNNQLKLVLGAAQGTLSIYNKSIADLKKARIYFDELASMFNESFAYYMQYGFLLYRFGVTLEGGEREKLLYEAIEKYNLSILNGGPQFCLIDCMLALGNISRAKIILENCLKTNEISLGYVKENEKWRALLKANTWDTSFYNVSKPKYYKHALKYNDKILGENITLYSY